MVVLNKADLPRKLDGRKVRAAVGANPVLEISALKGKNLNALRKALCAHFAAGPAGEEEIVLHARQRDRLKAILEALKRAEALLAGRHSEELPAEEIRTAIGLVGELTGEVRTEEVLAEIFDRFCVGK